MNSHEPTNQTAAPFSKLGGFLFFAGIALVITFLFFGIFLGIIPAVLLILIGANLKPHKPAKQNLATGDKEVDEAAVEQAFNSFVAERKKEQIASEDTDAESAYNVTIKNHNENLLRNKTYHMIYEDSSGNITERDIEINRIEPPYIFVFCHLRNENRKFSIDRIISISSRNTQNAMEVATFKKLKTSIGNTPQKEVKQTKPNNRIRELETIIKKYQKSYYTGEAEISDAEFDNFWDELREIDPENKLLEKTGQ